MNVILLTRISNDWIYSLLFLELHRSRAKIDILHEKESLL